MRRTWALASGIVLSLSACGTGDIPMEEGSLRPSEYNLALETAHRIQASVVGKFIGATAIASDRHRPPCDRDAECPDTRLVYIRLVWESANFTHGRVGRLSSAPEPSVAETASPPAASNQAMFIAIDPATNEVVARSAGYEASLAASADETLLYGHRP